MIQFLLGIPETVKYGCVVIVVAAVLMALFLFIHSRRVGSKLGLLLEALRFFEPIDQSQRRGGIPLSNLDELRSRVAELEGTPAEWWRTIETHVECYTDAEDHDGWFLVEQPRAILPYEVAVGRYFHGAVYNAFPGLLTGAGLALTFVAILLALHGVHYDRSNTAEPVSGIDILINGLSGKFVSSIVALVLSIIFTVYEKRRVRGLRNRYEQLIAALSDVIPYLSPSRVLLDIQRFAAKQTVSVSNISSEVVDRFVGSFNRDVVPALAEGMSSGVADKMQSEFRPVMQKMNETLEGLQAAIVGLESQKQESVTGEIRGLLSSLESSLVDTLSKMGDEFHSALTGAASQEFGNVQGTLEATRQMLSAMNEQFGSMQAAFGTIIEKAEQSTTDQLKTGRDQTEALIALMNGLMVRLQESADQNLSSVRSQLTLVVGDLAEKVGSLSKDMMTAAENVAKQSQSSADHVLEQTGAWSEATAKRLEALMTSIERRSEEFQKAGNSLLQARDFVTDVLSQNATALGRMADAGLQIQTYSTGLAGQSDALKGVSDLQSKTANQLREATGSLRASFEQNERLLSEHRRSFEGYRAVINELDESLARILDALHRGLRDYNAGIENNFREVVKISNELVPEVSSLLQTQVDELAGQLEELGTVISRALERVDGRAK